MIFRRKTMGKITAAAIVAILATFALPASASLADRKSDEQKTEQPAAPAPYSGHVVIRGEIVAMDHTSASRTFNI
jgi:Tfp pilus assembly protein FimT